MIIMESAIAMNRDYVECNNTLAKIDLFANTAYREYEINIKESALKVIKENGSEEDFDFLATEAAKDYVERAKKAIEKIIEAVKKFIRDCKDKLVKLIENVKVKTAIDKAEDACKSNSKLRSTKVKYEDTDKQAGIIKQGLDRINKKVAKIKAKGKATSADTEEIKEIENDTMKKVAAISAASVITLGGALVLLKHFSSKSEVDKEIPSEYDAPVDLSSFKRQLFTSNSTLSKTDSYEYDSNIHGAQEDPDAELMHFAVQSTRSHAAMTQVINKMKVSKLTTLINGIRSVFKSSNTSTNLNEQVSESTLEDLEMFACVVESAEIEETSDHSEPVAESVGTEEGLDLDQYFNEMCDELFTESEDEETNEDVTEETFEDTSDESTTEEEPAEVEDVETESTDTEETDMTEVYMEQLERELFGDDEEVTTESTDDAETSIASLLDEMENLL